MQVNCARSEPDPQIPWVPSFSTTENAEVTEGAPPDISHDDGEARFSVFSATSVVQEILRSSVTEGFDPLASPHGALEMVVEYQD